MEDVAYTPSHIPTGVSFCGRISLARKGGWGDNFFVLEAYILYFIWRC
jgi:hypothetical protein